jgi:hypothetical protein
MARNIIKATKYRQNRLHGFDYLYTVDHVHPATTMDLIQYPPRENKPTGMAARKATRRSCCDDGMVVTVVLEEGDGDE